MDETRDDVSARELDHLGARYLAEMLAGWGSYWRRIAVFQASAGPEVRELALGADPDTEKAFAAMVPLLASMLHPDVLDGLVTASDDVSRMICRVVDEWPEVLERAADPDLERAAVERHARKASPIAAATRSEPAPPEPEPEEVEPELEVEARLSRLETIVLGVGALLSSLGEAGPLLVLIVLGVATLVPSVPDDSTAAAAVLFS